MNEREKEAISNLMEKIAFSITGKEIKVNLMTDNELGYTSGNVIYIQCGERMLNYFVTRKFYVYFMFGVFAHELCHCLMSNFDALKQFINREPNKSKGAFSKFCNMLEDPSIEYFANEWFGDWLLEALYFSISTIYDKTELIETGETEYDEFETAMIQFGDMGKLKNNFKFDKSRNYFYDNIDDFNDIIHEVNGEKRVQKCFDLFQKIKDIFPLNEKLDKNCSNSGSGSNASENTGNSNSSDNSDGTSRNEKLDKIRGNEAKKAKEKEKKSEDVKSDDTEKSASKGKSESESKSEFEKDAKDKKNGTKSVSKDSMDNADVSEKIDENSINEMKAESLSKAIESMIGKMEKELEKSKKDLEANVDFTPQNIQLPEYGVSNYIEKVNFSQEHVQKYNEIVTKNAEKIKYLSSQYKNIFKNVNNGNLRNTSGNFNVNRYATKREQTLRYFDKRIAPTDKSDTSVLLLIDESGSMSRRMDDVKEHAIMIAESFISINIPIAVIGFNANMRTQESPEHTWYCDFDTSKINRYVLAGIHSKYDNFDGYSIKYATEVLSKRSSQNKLLIVISDGAPLCNYYKNRGRKINGYADTADAIRKAKEKVSTIGIHVGECDESIIFKLWGDAYITDKNDDISFALVNKLKTVVKKW